MNHLAAALLLSLSNQEINDKSIEEVLKAAGSKIKPDEIKKVVEKCKGKNHAALVKEGLAKLATMGGAVAGGAPAGDKKNEDSKKKEEPKKKEAPKKKEEKPAEEEEDGGLGLFD